MGGMNPFDLNDHDAYARWRDRKLANRPASLDELIVEIADPARPTPTERDAVHRACSRANLAIFVTSRPESVVRQDLKALAGHFGLRRLNHNEGADDDGVTVLAVAETAQWRNTYIPYTDRPIHWHTDGYYNRPEEQIHGLMLYCETPAPRGGRNALLDHELAYIHLREQDPELVRALMHPQAMTIPANQIDDHIERPARPGPVFSVRDDGRLHMRYTARRRNIEWRDDDVTREAARRLRALLESDSPWIHRATLQRGQGLICNNVLHDRAGFENSDEQRRLLYRLRFFDRIDPHFTAIA